MVRCFCGCGRRIRLRDWGADRHGRQTGWLVQSLADATEVHSDALTAPVYTRLVTAAHRWQDVWAGVVHSEAPSQDVDHDAWKRWRGEAFALLDRIMDAYEARWLEGANRLLRETGQLWTAMPRVQVREQCCGRERRHARGRAHDRRRGDHQQSPAD